MEIHVSLPFPLKAYDDQTPLHLAALKAMEMLITIFLQRDGNPNALNANAETCLHSLCQQSDQDSKRKRIMNLLLEWRGVSEDGEREEYLSVNRVDHDGNSPLHYASKNGLFDCILLLTSRNAIISIVNKDQMTCCEIAAASDHQQLADMLEIALIFPPPEQDILLFDDDVTQRTHQQVSSTQPIFLSDCETYTFETLNQWKKNCVDCVITALGLPETFAELILDHFNWELEKTLEEMLIHKEEVFEQLNLKLEDYNPIQYVVVPTPQPQATIETDVASLDEIFVDIGSGSDSRGGLGSASGDQSESNAESTSHGGSPSSRPRVVEVTNPDISVGTCLVCGEELYPTISPQHLTNNSLPYREQREILCPAGHSYCSTCWAHHWTVQINDNSACFLHCMTFKCGHILPSEEWAIPVLGETMAEKLKSNLLRRIVDVSSRWRWCPAKDCDSIIYLSNSSTSLDSPAAVAAMSGGLKSVTPEKTPSIPLPQSAICGNGHAICLSCTGESHAPCSCEHWTSWLEKIQQEISISETEKSETGGPVDVASALWVAANTKKCPRCQTPIEKNEGCNHMTCRKCRYEFCWICFQDWEKHSNRTGGYFQCTIYAGNNPSNGNDGRDDLVPRIDLDDDYGSAAKEAARARERAEMMDRFIHHYTRYRAHSDSLALEQKMHTTNIHRIRHSLHASAIGTNPWLQGPSAQHPYLSDDFHSLKQSSSPPSEASAAGGGGHDALLCAAEATDLSLAKGGDWSAETNSPLLFLQRGFRELIKCRQVLKGSFPMAFYMMTDEQESPSYSRWRHFDYEAAQRRAYAESRAKVFLEIQSDLEILTETLSDVVARRRLRASANQISRATFLARSRRIEFEAVIKRHYEAYEQDKAAEAQEAQQARTKSSTRSASRSNRGPSSYSSSRLSRSHYMTGEYDESEEGEGADFMDPALRTILESLRDTGLVDDIEAYNMATSPRIRSAMLRQSIGRAARASSRTGGATRRTPDWQRAARGSNRRGGGGDQEEDGDDMEEQSTRTLTATTSGSDQTLTPAQAQAEGQQQAQSSMREILMNAGWSESDLRREGFAEDSESPRTPLASSQTPRRTPHSASASATTDHVPIELFATPDGRDRAGMRAGAREERGMGEEDDEEEINRAILMSLQERQPSYANTDRPEPAEELVALLIGMGFARDSSVQALKDYGENVEDAIMFLANRG